MKTLAVALIADVSNLARGLRAGGAEIDRFEKKVAASGNAHSQAAAAASAGSRKTQDAVKKSTAEINRQRAALEKNREVTDKLGAGALIMGASIAAGFAMGTRATMSFDKAMSSAEAATGANVRQMGQLREAALKAGAASVFTATEAAQAQTELAKAGISTADILGGALTGSLNLAAAGQLGVARSAEIAATAMTIFKLNGQDVGHIADVLAAGAGKAQGEVEDIAQAMQQGGLVASQFGLSLEDTVGTLGLFASKGLLGSDAGTSFKTMLARMVPTTEEAANAMDDLGLSFFDSQGKFVGIEEAAGRLQEAMKGLTQEQQRAYIQTVFGQDAVRSAGILFEEGAEGVRKWRDNVNDAGFAARTASTKLDNLAGDVEQLTGSLETALISSGGGINGVMRETVQTLTALVNGYNDLPGPVKAAANGFMLAAGAVTLVGGAALIAVPRFMAFKLAMSQATGISGALGQGLAGVAGKIAGPLSIALVAGTAVLASWAKEKAKATATVDGFVAALTADSNALGVNTRAEARNLLEKEGALKAAEKLGVSLSDVTDAALGNDAALRRVADAIEAHRQAGDDDEKAQLKLLAAIKGTNKGLDDAQASVNRLNDAAANTPEAILEARDSFEAYGGSIQTAAEQTEMLTEQQKEAAKAADDYAKKVQDAFLGASDVISGFKPVSRDEQNAKQLEAIDKLKTAEQALNDVREQQDAKKKTTVADEQALRKAREEVATATEGLRKVESNRHGTSQQLKQFYADQIAEAKAFVGQINEATRRGLDPKIIARLLEAGPEAAKPVLEAMLKDHSGRTIRIANDAEEQLRVISGRIAEFARLTNRAVASATDEMTGNLDTAMKIAAAKMAQGAKASVDSIAKAIGVPSAQVRSVAEQYGITIAATVQAGINSRPLRPPVMISTGRPTGSTFNSQVPRQGRAHGGYVTGPGTSTSDSIPAWLSNGEFVMRAAAVSRIGVDQLNRENARGYATGGLVTSGDDQPQSFVSAQSVMSAVMSVSDTNGKPVPFTWARYEAELRKQLAAQQAWRAQIARITRLAGKEVGDALYEMGEEGTALVARMANGTDAEVRRMAASFARLVPGVQSPFDAWADGLEKAKQDTAQFNRDLAALTKRGRADIADALREMGVEEGGKIARGAAQMSSRGLELVARDLPKQITALQQWRKELTDTKRAQEQFDRDLAQLAERGRGGLAATLKAMGVGEAGAIAKEAARASDAAISEIARLIPLQRTEFEKYADGLHEATAVQAAFNTDITTLVRRGHADLADALKGMGAEQAGAIARQAADASDEALAAVSASLPRQRSEFEKYTDSVLEAAAAQAEFDRTLAAIEQRGFTGLAGALREMGAGSGLGIARGAAGAGGGALAQLEATFPRQVSALEKYVDTLYKTAVAQQKFDDDLRALNIYRDQGPLAEHLRSLGVEAAGQIAAQARTANDETLRWLAQMIPQQAAAKTALQQYTENLDFAARSTAAFEQNLANLSARGQGSLVEALRAMGVEQAGQIAYEAAMSTGAALDAISALLPRQQSALAAYAGNLRTTVDAQRQFNADILTLVDQGRTALADAFLGMGADQAGSLARAAVNATGADLDRISGDVAAQADLAKRMADMPQLLKLLALLKTGAGLKGLVDGSGIDIPTTLTLLEKYRGMISSLPAGSLAAINADLAAINSGRQPKGYALGGLAPEGTRYRYAERGTGGEWLIPRQGISQTRAEGLLRAAGASYGVTVAGSGVSVSVGQIVVQTQPGMDEHAVGRIVRREFEQKLGGIVRHARAGRTP